MSRTTVSKKPKQAKVVEDNISTHYELTPDDYQLEILKRYSVDGITSENIGENELLKNIVKIFKLNVRTYLPQLCKSEDKHIIKLNYAPHITNGIIMEICNREQCPEFQHIGVENGYKLIIIYLHRNNGKGIYIAQKVECGIVDKVSIKDGELLSSINDKISGYENSDRKKKRGKCTLTPEEVVEIINKYDAKCDQCDRYVLFDYRKNCRLQYSIDRKNNELPHTFDNCRLTCLGCNQCDDKFTLPDNKCSKCTDKSHNNRLEKWYNR